MSEMYEKAKIQLQQAKHYFEHRGDNIAFIDSACYNIHGCLESLLIYALEQVDVVMHPTHDLIDPLKCLMEHGVHNELLSKISINTSKYNEWGACPRLDDNQWELEADVKEALQLCEQMMQYVVSMPRIYKNVGDPIAIEWCRRNAPDALKHLSDEELWSEMSELYYKYR